MTFAKRSIAFWVGLFLLPFGAIFLAIGAVTIQQERQFQREGEVAEGIVLTKAIQQATRSGSNGRRSSTEYNVTYRFTAPDGQSYEGTQDVSVAAWDGLREQEPVQVQYVASDPSTNRIAGEESWAIGYIFPGIGIVAAAIGAVLLARSLRSSTRKARIWVEGAAAEATVSAVEETNVTVNKRPMWIVRYQYRDHLGQMHDGTSDYMSGDKANAWKRGDTIRVRFDRQEPNTNVWME
jgi:hypothetical protein